jgi:hypothetical protein
MFQVLGILSGGFMVSPVEKIKLYRLCNFDLFKKTF